MKRTTPERSSETVDSEWLAFPGGELEGTRPKVMCPACRAGRSAASAARPALCFQCYRAGLERERALQAAARLDTASEARFQVQLPFEPVNHARLARLKVERRNLRAQPRERAAHYVDKRRQAQIAARHTLERLAQGLGAGGEGHRMFASAVHAAELQLPEAWLPYVVAR